MKEGDLITILAQEDEGWWEGELNGKKGVFPSNFVEIIEEDHAAVGNGVLLLSPSVSHLFRLPSSSSCRR